MPVGPSGASAPRSNSNERFVAFAFAGADIVAETDADGTITYAAGALRSKFGRPPEAFVGRTVRDLVAPADHEALDAALSLLVARGRLQPMMIRLADPCRTPLALAGIAIPSPAHPLRLNLSFARPPTPIASVLRAGSAHGLARAAEARLRAGAACDLGLLEILGTSSLTAASGEAIGEALETAVPNAVASEISPGRFGLLGPGGSEAELIAAAHLVECTLRAQGIEVAVSASHLPLQIDGLTLIQAARALRQALNVFARGGPKGFAEAGFKDGLAGFMRRATAQADTLRRAIQGGHFSLVFQPIVALEGGAAHHYEALIRPEPIKGATFDSPQAFVMLVEALGLAEDLDLAVAARACEAAGEPGPAIAFNLSGQSVQSPHFRNRLVQLLAASPARKRGNVLVEITETAEIEAVDEASLTAEALRMLKVPYCLDDFGAGASDLRLLRALSPDIVKLDGSYLPGVAGAGRERAFIAGMVEIARAAGAEIVAERVETAAEAAVLRSFGVDYGQGWLFGRPGALPRPRRPAAKVTAPVRGEKIWS